MKPVVSYTLSRCQKCLRCLKVCPTEAIIIQDERVKINASRCTNCGQCIQACLNQGLQSKGSTLFDLQNYDYTIALVPSALYSVCKNYDEAQQLTAAIQHLGFDEVKNLSDIEATLANEALSLAKNYQGKSQISSFCPVVRRLIEIRYPMLLSCLSSLDYPSEVAARMIRKSHPDKQKLGIFYLCECVSKLTLAKYPYGNTNSEVDHAVSIVDLFPRINALKNEEKQETSLCKEGLQTAILEYEQLIEQPLRLLHADGLEKVNQALELAEFGILYQFDYLALSSCINGCVGGRLLWGNPFSGKNNISALLPFADKLKCSLSKDELYNEEAQETAQDVRSMIQKLSHFSKVNQQLELLPGFDCGACGFPSCRIMAEEIVNGVTTLQDCRVKKMQEEKDENQTTK